MLINSAAVDDYVVTGNETDIEWFMDNVEKRFNITRDGGISKHLGVIYDWGETENRKMYCKATMDKKSQQLLTRMKNILAKRQKFSVLQELRMKT